MKDGSTDKFRKRAAHRMRNAAVAEARLWRRLRQHPMSGSHFRRQVVIGPYIADFACMAAKLIVEVDGGNHGEAPDMARDAARTDWLADQGFTVLRYWNNDVSSNIDGVMNDIHAALAAKIGGHTILKHERWRKPSHPTPAGKARRPSPSRGG